jgi:hypothetical protein
MTPCTRSWGYSAVLSEGPCPSQRSAHPLMGIVETAICIGSSRSRRCHGPSLDPNGPARERCGAVLHLCLHQQSFGGSDLDPHNRVAISAVPAVVSTALGLTIQGVSHTTRSGGSSGLTNRPRVSSGRPSNGSVLGRSCRRTRRFGSPATHGECQMGWDGGSRADPPFPHSPPLYTAP